MRTLLPITMCILVLSGCTGTQATPEEVVQSYARLKAELDEDTPGASTEKLETFRKQNARYQIAKTISEDIARLRSKAKGQFHRARDLARDGKFDQAEKILHDLSRHFSDAEEGKMAKQFMQFDLYALRATRLMMDRRLHEAEQTVREALRKDLTQEQIFQLERMLDGISNAKLSQAMSSFAQLQSIARNLHVLLEMHHAENGRYPASLSLDDLRLGDPSIQNRIREALLAIEDYQVSDNRYSFVAVGKDGKTRLRVTPGEIQKLE